MRVICALLSSSAVLLLLQSAATSASLNTTCKAIWLFELPCSEPVAALVNQVQAWSSKKCLDSQEKCMYKLVEESPTSLEIKHTSRNTQKVTEIRVEAFGSENSYCKLRSQATSNNATNPNDYCLFYNLIKGSGLTEAAGYRKICYPSMCPAVKSAVCK